MQINHQIWNEIFEREGRVFEEVHEEIPAIAQSLKINSAKRILDLGCGTGRHVVYFAKQGFEVYGLDASPEGIRLTQAWLDEVGERAVLCQQDMREPLPYPDQFFDALISIQVIHHAKLAEIKAVIQEVFRILKPGGFLFISVPKAARENVNSNEIEPNTFVPREGREIGLPHHIFSEEELREAFADFNITDIHLNGHHNCMTACKPELKEVFSMDQTEPQKRPLYEQIYAIVRQIPPGKVASYGQIAKIVGRCTPRMVGYAMSALRNREDDVPWQRVINSQGKISVHGNGIGTAMQRQLLEDEGVVFDNKGQVDWAEFGWLGEL